GGGKGQVDGDRAGVAGVVQGVGPGPAVGAGEAAGGALHQEGVRPAAAHQAGHAAEGNGGRQEAGVGQGAGGGAGQGPGGRGGGVGARQAVGAAAAGDAAVQAGAGLDREEVRGGATHQVLNGGEADLVEGAGVQPREGPGAGRVWPNQGVAAGAAVEG